MHPAKGAPMRSALAFVAVLAGCGTLDAHWRPSIMPKLSQLPRHPHHRDAIADQSSDRARPEQRRSLTAKERKVETTAAWMAALIGSALSKSSTVMFGVATDIEENHLFEK